MTTRVRSREKTTGPIARSDLDACRVDLAEVDGGERLGPTHPGKVLRHEFLEPLGLSAHALALALRVPANRITAILAGRRAVTAETALRLARHLGTTPGLGRQGSGGVGVGGGAVLAVVPACGEGQGGEGEGGEQERRPGRGRSGPAATSGGSLLRLSSH